MGLFSKKKEESILPDLPDDSSFLPNLPEYDLDNSVDNLSSVDNFSEDIEDRNVIKSYNDEGPNFKNMQKSSFEPLPKYNTMVNEKIVAEPLYVNKVPNKIIEPRTFEISSKFKEENYSKVKNSQPVYVRLDSFKQGLESFEDIKSKISEIENLLSRIKEMREKEEKELMEWEKEIQVIKARIEKINSDIFRNVE